MDSNPIALLKVLSSILIQWASNIQNDSGRCKICQYLLKKVFISGLTKWKSLGGKKNVPKHFYKMGSNTPTLRNHGLGQIFHTHEKKLIM